MNEVDRELVAVTLAEHCQIQIVCQCDVVDAIAVYDTLIDVLERQRDAAQHVADNLSAEPPTP